MNRRSFLGFACGGVVAAPAAVLVGERALNCGNGYAVGEIGPEVTNLPKPVTVIVDHVSAAGDEHIRKTVQRAVDIAMRQAEAMRHRGAIMRG